jgi:hypothetical protein
MEEARLFLFFHFIAMEKKRRVEDENQKKKPGRDIEVKQRLTPLTT